MLLKRMGQRHGLVCAAYRWCEKPCRRVSPRVLSPRSEKHVKVYLNAGSRSMMSTVDGHRAHLHMHITRHWSPSFGLCVWALNAKDVHSSATRASGRVILSNRNESLGAWRSSLRRRIGRFTEQNGFLIMGTRTVSNIYRESTFRLLSLKRFPILSLEPCNDSPRRILSQEVRRPMFASWNS